MRLQSALDLCHSFTEISKRLNDFERKMQNRQRRKDMLSFMLVSGNRKIRLSSKSNKIIMGLDQPSFLMVALCVIFVILLTNTDCALVHWYALQSVNVHLN